jgi:hypothetical protein
MELLLINPEEPMDLAMIPFFYFLSLIKPWQSYPKRLKIRSVTAPGQFKKPGKNSGI